MRIPVAERGSKITDFMCSKFLTSSVDSTTSFHSNSFDSVDEENSASSQVDALLSASFELEEKVESISNSLHMGKKQNKETEKKFQKLSAKYIKIKKEKELLASATKENKLQPERKRKQASWRTASFEVIDFDNQFGCSEFSFPYRFFNRHN